MPGEACIQGPRAGFPSKTECRIWPLLPTTKTSPVPLPHTPKKFPGWLRLYCPGRPAVGGVQDRLVGPHGEHVAGAAAPHGQEIVGRAGSQPRPGGAVVGRVQDQAVVAHGEHVRGAAAPHAEETLRRARGLRRPGGGVVGGMEDHAGDAHGEHVVGAAAPYAQDFIGRAGGPQPESGRRQAIFRATPTASGPGQAAAPCLATRPTSEDVFALSYRTSLFGNGTRPSMRFAFKGAARTSGAALRICLGMPGSPGQGPRKSATKNSCARVFPADWAAGHPLATAVCGYGKSHAGRCRKMVGFPRPGPYNRGDFSTAPGPGDLRPMTPEGSLVHAGSAMPSRPAIRRRPSSFGGRSLSLRLVGLARDKLRDVPGVDPPMRKMWPSARSTASFATPRRAVSPADRPRRPVAAAGGHHRPQGRPPAPRPGTPEGRGGAAAVGDSANECLDLVLSREPDPEFAAEVAEECRRLLRQAGRRRSGIHRGLADGRLHGGGDRGPAGNSPATQ